MNDNDFRIALGQRIKAARRAKFRTVDKARMAADIARGTWDKAEKGEPIKDFSLAAIERTLGWEEGYAASILAGKDPARRGLALIQPGADEVPRVRTRKTGFDGYLEMLEDRLDDLESRVARLEGSDDETLSDVDVELPAAAKEGVVEEPGEFNT